MGLLASHHISPHNRQVLIGSMYTQSYNWVPSCQSDHFLWYFPKGSKMNCHGFFFAKMQKPPAFGNRKNTKTAAWNPDQHEDCVKCSNFTFSLQILSWCTTNRCAKNSLADATAISTVFWYAEKTNQPTWSNRESLSRQYHSISKNPLRLAASQLPFGSQVFFSSF